MRKVDPKMNFPKLEAEVLEYWKRERIFEKSVERRDAAKTYSFYDGPPFATGLPHYGHLLQSILKDVVPRFKTMQGYRVPRVWGWDCHGLPIENLVEKELGFKNKKDIVAYGVERFDEACRSKVLEFTQDWKTYIERIGRFVDMEHPYKTMDADYMESVWWVFKELWDKGLIYEDYRIMHVCPHCETTLSQAEVSEGYEETKDLAATVKFELTEKPGTFLLAWTTTPWTLPGNVALAVNKDIEYAEVESEGVKYIAAAALLEQVFAGKEYTEARRFPGSELLGKAYRAPFDDYQKNTALENYENGWKVYHADFVTIDKGTGVAHEAPAFGADDWELLKQEHLPFVQHVSLDGTIKAEVPEFAGQAVKTVEDPQVFDVQIIKALAKKGLLFSKEQYLHDYPHCWRCDTPLLNYATSSWFVAVEKVKGNALRNAEQISWSPEHVKAGRFGKWLEGARDWSISRQRFWASCMPLWVCECGAQLVVGSRQALEEKSGKQVTDLHKHVLDGIVIPCEQCGGEMRRVPDVLDTWFDSGSMPYASKHFMGGNEGPEGFPADFIAEMVEQSRTWFYYLHILGTALFDTPAFHHASATGVILAADGKKMSKKLGNYPDPLHILDAYGADALRLYILSSPVVAAENLHFSEDDLASLTKNVFRMLWNSYSFFTVYAEIDGWKPKVETKLPENILDRWILAELQALTSEVTEAMEEYDIQRAARAFAPFIDNLSNWYIRRSRKRFWKNENDTDKEEAYGALYTVLVSLAKLMAPFTPFVSEEIYRNLTGEESVHLADWPKAEDSLADKTLSQDMYLVRERVTEALKLRSDRAVRVRQPLASVIVPEAFAAPLQQIFCEELNVKKVKKGEVLDFDWEITPELKLEGEAREIIRVVQEGRKKAGFNVEDRIALGYAGKQEVFEKFGEEIAAEVLALSLQADHLDGAEYNETVDIAGVSFAFSLKRV